MTTSKPLPLVIEDALPSLECELDDLDGLPAQEAARRVGRRAAETLGNLQLLAEHPGQLDEARIRQLNDAVVRLNMDQVLLARYVYNRDDANTSNLGTRDGAAVHGGRTGARYADVVAEIVDERIAIAGVLCGQVGEPLDVARVRRNWPAVRRAWQALPPIDATWLIARLG